jgi:dTDP-4-dehydrorhamnose reductase
MGLKSARIAIITDDRPLGAAMRQALTTDEVIMFHSNQYDITKWSICATIRDASPDVVIHLASLDSISECEQYPEVAYEVNYVGTQNVALGCKATGASLVYLSTADVFPGEPGKLYKEFATPGPVNIWGKSKLAGEEIVRQTLHEFYIVRTSWLVGQWVQTRSSEKIATESASSIVGNPTYVVDLAGAISQLIRSARYGTYHLVNEGSCTLHDFLKTVRSLFSGDLPLQDIFPLDLDTIDKGKQGNLLCNSIASKQIGVKLRPWEAALSEYASTIRATIVM